MMYVVCPGTNVPLISVSVREDSPPIVLHRITELELLEPLLEPQQGQFGNVVTMSVMSKAEYYIVSS